MSASSFLPATRRVRLARDFWTFSGGFAGPGEGSRSHPDRLRGIRAAALNEDPRTKKTISSFQQIPGRASESRSVIPPISLRLSATRSGVLEISARLCGARSGDLERSPLLRNARGAALRIAGNSFLSQSAGQKVSLSSIGARRAAPEIFGLLREARGAPAQISASRIGIRRDVLETTRGNHGSRTPVSRGPPFRRPGIPGSHGRNRACAGRGRSRMTRWAQPVFRYRALTVTRWPEPVSTRTVRLGTAGMSPKRSTSASRVSWPTRKARPEGRPS